VCSKEEAITLFPELNGQHLVKVDHICDLDQNGLSIFPDAHFDFVICNHVIEHVANPIKTVQELFRITKPDGYVVISAPDKKYTFDQGRKMTPFAHLLDEYQNEVTQVTDGHYLDFLRVVYPGIFSRGGEILQAHLQEARSRREHAHVWNSKAFGEFIANTLNFFKIQAECAFISTGDVNQFEYFAIWKKSPSQLVVKITYKPPFFHRLHRFLRFSELSNQNMLNSAIEPFKWQWLWLFPIFLLPLAYFSYLNRTLQIDDALIYQRYIRNLLDGHGLVYNPGEYFNGLTSPLYTYLSIATSYLLNNTQIAAMALSTAFMALALIIFTILFSRYAKIHFVLLGAIFATCLPYFYLTYGMETSLFIFLIGWCIYLFDRKNDFLLGIACALLFLARGEGLFLILALGVEFLRQNRPFPKLYTFVLPIFIVAASFAFNKWYFGTFLTETMAVKIYQGQSGLWGEWPSFAYIGYQSQWFFSSSRLLIYSLLTLSLLGVLSLRFQSINIISVNFLIFYTLFFVSLNLPNYHWYYAPFYLFIFFYAGIGIAWLIQNFLMANDRLFKIVGIGTVFTLIFTTTYLSFTVTRTKPDIGGYAKPYRIIGEWLKANTPVDAKVALMEIGTVGWYSERYIIDMLGLVNPLNAKFMGKRDFSEWLRHYSPDYIVIHDPLAPHEVGIRNAVLLGDFAEESRLQVKRFKLLAKQQDIPVNFLPVYLSLPHQMIIEDGRYALLVHAPGEVHFHVMPGEYTLTGQFGIDDGAYAQNNPHITDGVEFSAVIKENGQNQPLFQRFLNPANVETDRGTQTFTTVPFTVDKKSLLSLQTQPGPANDAQSDWSFWRAISIEKR